MTIEDMIRTIRDLSADGQIAAANAFLWRWPDDMDIAEGLALRGPDAIDAAARAHLDWLFAHHATETQSERTARQMMHAAGLATAIDGLPGPLPARLAMMPPPGLADEVRQVETERRCSTAEACIAAIAARLESAAEVAA